MDEEYIIIETFGGAECSAICTHEDGTIKVFHNEQAAYEYAEEDCQEGLVVQIQ